MIIGGFVYNTLKAAEIFKSCFVVGNISLVKKIGQLP